MSLNSGKKPGKLADMSERPSELTYEVPPDLKAAADEFDIPLGEGVNVRVRQCLHRGRIVDFSLNQFVGPDYEGNRRQGNEDVARIDCCHSEIHRHQFYRSGRDQNYYVIRSLKGEPDHESAERVVHQCYDHCYAELTDNFEDYLERWEDDNVW